jgi:hypothetical protein
MYTEYTNILRPPLCCVVLLEQTIAASTTQQHNDQPIYQWRVMRVFMKQSKRFISSGNSSSSDYFDASSTATQSAKDENGEIWSSRRAPSEQLFF